jgi:tRNA(Arg) A34 adenosine deaminase TadA
VSYDHNFMALAIAQSARALDEPGLEPFGAVVVRDGVVIGQGVNHTKKHFDPTSHGETEAIRDACRRLQCTALEGATLYSSCEPCALCVATMAIVGIDTVYFAGSLEGSNAVLAVVPESVRARGDVAALRVEAGQPVGRGRIRAEAHPNPTAEAILRAWAARQG